MDSLTKISGSHEEGSESCSTEADPDRERKHTLSSSNLASDDESHSSRGHGNGSRALPSFPRRRERAREVASTAVDYEHSHNSSDHIRDTSGETPQRAWYEFDFVVVLALVSPVGNWLTGGDHIKNILFVALLVFYLHQVIEVPWEVYQKSRRRYQLPDFPLNPEDRSRKLAISELRKVELFCLALTTVSPFVGASLFRYTTHFVLGPESISWFSTGLFVMATGIRPWSHLIERLNQRTADLQDFIHYPPSSSRKPARDIQKDVDILNNRVDKLERSLNGMRDRLKVTSEDIFDHVDDALDSVRRSLRKRQKQCDEQGERLRFMEKSITSLSELRSGPGKRSGLTMVLGMTITTARSIFPKWSFSPLQWFGGRSNRKPRRSPRLSTNGVAIPERLRTIQEEDNAAIFPLDKSVEISVKLLYHVMFVMLLPFRLVSRILFWR